jgi:hypothetical protein
VVRRILTGIGLLFIAGALLIGWVTGARYMLSGEKAIGIVVAMTDDDAPVVEFLTQSGETRQYKGLGSSPPDHYVGERVAMRYFPDDPKAATISSSFQELWLGATVVAVFGVIFLGVAWIVGRMDRTGRPKPQQQQRQQPQAKRQMVRPRRR